MGAVHSLLHADSAPPSHQDSTGQQRLDAEHTAQSKASSKMLRDMTTKFSELELHSLRQVFQQLKTQQDTEQQAQQTRQAEQPEQDATSTTQKPLLGLTEDTFAAYINIGPDQSRAEQLFFRSFCNLAAYPDSPRSQTSGDAPQCLTSKDLIKPLALYCQKVGEDTLMGVKPLKAIFESFADNSKTKVCTDDGKPSLETDKSLPRHGEGSLQKSKTMEDSLKDLTLHSNFEWNPEDDDLVASGPRVKAMDLVEVLDGLFRLTRVIATQSTDTKTNTSSNSQTLATPHHSGSHQHKAARIVEHIIQYSRTEPHVHDPVDLTTESIDYAMFSKFVSRNAPNIFAVLSPYFYSLFLMGHTLRPPAEAGTTTRTLTLPAFSPIPVLDSASTMITPENLALLSWFLPPGKTTPTMTNLYTGSVHGFSMNQFEVHVCKYPGPTLLLLLVERQKNATPTLGRRQSISFGTARPRQSISGASPPYSNIPWGIDNRRPSIDQLTARAPGSVGAAGTSTLKGAMVDEPAGGSANKPESSQDTFEVGTVPIVPRRNKERMILGAYVTETWKVSKAGWGNDSFELFELSPCFEVFPAKKPNNVQSSAFPVRASASQPSAAAATPHRHYIHFLKNAGVGFGGHDSESCMLYMDDNLHYGNYRQDFAGGNVYMSAGGARHAGFDIDFEVVECEVWGLGGAEAKTRQTKDWEFEQREANRRASVQLRGKNGEQDIDRDLLEMAGVIDPDRGHRHARRQSPV
ncbi:Restriction of telomere capping protein 5 [Mortierella alpina]|uniref:Restriction of telomere capping protein 5 n=1 Tax=Mortierella alpina TaxID=64518 RepID=A0A9P6JFA2_MORAP|nr:Restriction of telomere capping protein 5 [Mortierella alpina]